MSKHLVFKFKKDTTPSDKVFLISRRIAVIKKAKGELIKNKIHFKTLDSYNAELKVLEKQRKDLLEKIAIASNLNLF